MLGGITMVIIIIIIFHFLSAKFLECCLLLAVSTAVEMQTVIEQVNNEDSKFDSF